MVYGKHLMSSTGAQDKVFLPLVGLLSGVLTCVMFVPGIGQILMWTAPLYTFPGIVFGLAVARYFSKTRGIRSRPGQTGFVAVSIVACAASVWLTFYLPLPMSFLDWPRGPNPTLESGTLFNGGFAGSAILFLGFYLYFSRTDDVREYVIKAFCFCVLSGLLGILGWTLVPLLLQGIVDCRATLTCNLIPLYIVWQTGVAFFLALLSPDEETGGKIDFEPRNAERQEIPAGPAIRRLPLITILITAIAMVG